MECSFRYTRNNDLGIVELTGKKDFGQARWIWEGILYSIRDDGLAKVIIVDLMIDSLTELHVCELGKWLGSCRFLRGVKVAIIDPTKTAEGNMNAFGETVLLNRGFYNIRVFPDHETAGLWLGTECPVHPDT